MFKHIIYHILLGAITFLTLCPTANAQTAMEDVLYLKDGSIIRGQVKEHIIGEHIKIELLGGSILVYEESEVIKIAHEPALEVTTTYSAQVAPRKHFSDLPITVRGPRTIYNMFGFGLAFGQGANGDIGLNPSFIYKAGMHFNQHLNVGLGLGLDVYSGGTVAPLMVNVSGELGKPALVMPHYFLDAGYGMSLGGGWNTELFRGGPMMHVGGGWKFNSRRRSEWTLTMGYKFQHTYQEQRIWVTPSGIPIETPGGAIAAGTRLYQKIVMQVAIGF